MKKLTGAVLLLLLVALGLGSAACSKSPTSGPQPTTSIEFVTPGTTSETGDSGSESSAEETSTPGPDQDATVSTVPAADQPGDATNVNLLGVGLTAEGAMIIVEFKTEPVIARKWQQGSVHVTDESNQVVYAQIPVMPVLGPLFGHPARIDQVGYVMFQNTPPHIVRGSRVTVVLGGFRKEHVIVN